MLFRKPPLLGPPFSCAKSPVILCRHLRTSDWLLGVLGIGGSFRGGGHGGGEEDYRARRGFPPVGLTRLNCFLEPKPQRVSWILKMPPIERLCLCRGV